MPSKKAPAHMSTSRTPDFQPRLRQRRFPERRRHVMPSTTPARSTFETRRQTTLTQIDFIPRFGGEINDSEDDSEEHDAIASTERTRKRRKTSGKFDNMRTDSQKTLTQIKFVRSSQSDEYEDDEENELIYEQNNEVRDHGQDVDEPWHQSFVEETAQTQPEAPHTTHEPPSQHLKHDTPSPLAKPEPSTQPALKLHTTPQRQPRHEIPSSQSPAATPFTIPPNTPTQRSPLQELPLNVVAQRDSTSSPASPHPKKRRKPHPSTNTDDDDTDQENLHPSSAPLLTKPIRSSQASTVPPTQEAVFSTPPERRPVVPSSQRDVEGAELPLLLSSPPDGSAGDCSPVGTIHASDEIVTVSQLVSASLMGESG